MEIILAVIAIIIVIAIIAVILLRKKQPLEETPVAPQQAPTVAEPAVAPTPTANPLADAQVLIDEQRYDEAAQLIKKVLVTNPKNNTALFKLLQIYGLTDNQAAFAQLHKKIHQLGDPKTIADADELYDLLQDSPSTSETLAHSASSASLSEQADSLSLNDFTDSEPTLQALDTPEPETDTNLTFDASEFDLTGDNNTAQSELSPEDEFSLDFEPNETSTQSQETSSLTLGDELDALADFDLNFDHQSSDEAPEQVTASDDESITEDNELLSSEFEFDLSMDQDDADDKPLPDDSDILDVEAVESDSEQQGDVSIGDDDFALSFDVDDEIASDLAQEMPLDTNDNEVKFDDDLGFDDDLDLDASSLDSEDQSNELVSDDELLLDDFVFENEGDQPGDSDTSIEGLSDDTFDFSDLEDTVNDLPDTPLENTPDTLIIDEALDDVATDESSDDSQLPDSLTHQESAAALPDGLDFVDGLDSVQITLSLAHQYIELGEHDSAKRLLTEVIEHGNDEQQQQASKLLTHIA